MGCSSLTMLQNQFLIHSNISKFSTALFNIGCLWDIFSGDIDIFSKKVLQEIGRDPVGSGAENLYRAV